MLLLGNQRPEIDVRIEAVADLDLAGFGADALDDAVIDRFVGEEPRTRRAALALIVEDRRGGPEMARSMSASGKTIAGDLPPSSSDTRLRLPAAALTMSLPTSVEPVKATLSTSGWSASAAPAVSPKPVMMLTTPSGNPAS